MRSLMPVAVLGSALLVGCSSSRYAPSAYPPPLPYPLPPASSQAPVPASEPAVLPSPAPALEPEAVRRAPPPPAPRQLADGAQLPAVKGLLATADAALAKGDVDLAAANLERAQRLAPQSAVVYQKLASVRLRQKRPAEAEQLARKALGYAGSAERQAALWQVIANARQMRGLQAEAQEARARAAALQAGAAP